MTKHLLRSEYADDPSMSEVIGLFLAGLPGTVQSALQAIEEGDQVRLRRIGHQMKGAGGGYGFPLLSDVGCALEQAVDREGQINAAVLGAFQQFRQACESACASA